MPQCPEASPQAGHPDVAGWVLGALSTDDAAAFDKHLQSCPVCQDAVTDLEPIAAAMGRAAAEPLPPPELFGRTLAAVTEAVAATDPGRPAARRLVPFWRSWNLRLVGLMGAAATAVVVIAVFAFVWLSAAPAGPGQAFTIALHGPPGSSASGKAVAHPIDGGFSIRLSVRGLADLGPDHFYECWYAGAQNRPGAPQLITAGTFMVGRSGSVTVDMTSSADPRVFPTMQISVERSGDAAQHGKIVLSGTARG